MFERRSIQMAFKSTCCITRRAISVTIVDSASERSLHIVAALLQSTRLRIKRAMGSREGIVTKAREELDSTFSMHLAESLRIIAILISPVLPKAAHGIFDQLNWKMELSGKEERFSLADAEWGRLPDGHVVGKPMPLFPRIEC